MDQKKDILKDLKNKGTGFKIPENYLEDLTIDIPEDSSILPKSNGFKVPENYFNELEQRLSENLDSKIPAETGFKVPDGYFKDFDVKPEKNVPKVIQLFKRNRMKIIGLSVAASVLLLFSIFPLFNNKETLDFDSLSDNEIETWLETNSNEINSIEFADIIDDNDDLYAVEMISEQDISDYLIQTDLERWLPDN
jgi:hypothetical protein